MWARRWGRCPSPGVTVFFPAMEPAIAISGVTNEKRPMNMATPPVTLYQLVLVRQAAEGRPVVPVHGGVDVQDLGQSVRTGIND